MVQIGRQLVKRYLIVGNETLSGPALTSATLERLAEGPTEFHVVVPCTPIGGSAGPLAAVGDPLTGYVDPDAIVTGDLRDQAFDEAVSQGCMAHGTIGQWGLRLANRLKEAQQLPIMVINGAVGGTQVEAHQRNDDDPTDATTIYGRLLWRVQQAGVADAVRAIFWHQGESNGTQAYATPAC